MGKNILYHGLVDVLIAISLGMVASAGAVAQDRSISKFRGKNLFLYNGSSGDVVERLPVEDLSDAMPIPVTGGPENGRYQVNIESKGTFWIAKKQVKASNFADNDIKAKCESLTKGYASTRGASEGCSQ